jgi:16S rRNA (cytidine1402-2'-O)-methyltransferase
MVKPLQGQAHNRKMLYLVPTPIGNLEDITFRALQILKSADGILAEDTRTSGLLLKHFDIKKPLSSFHIHNEHQKIKNLILQLKEGQHLALISDAGTPGISDPGFLLVREALAEGIEVQCLPGPTALIPALVVSGFSTDRFLFEGFLPQKKGRQTRLRQALDADCTVVLFESPYRVVKLLEEIMALGQGERRISVSREISKKFEETRRGSVQEVFLSFQQKEPKGEFVVCLEGKKASEKSQNNENE